MRVAFSKPKDQGEILTADGGVIVLQINSDSGIGGAQIKPGESGWPQQVVVRLMGFGMLEGFTLGNSHVTWSGSLAAGRGRAERLKEDGTPTGDVVDDPDYVVRIEKKKGYIEIVVPSAMYAKDVPRVDLHWIDAYR